MLPTSVSTQINTDKLELRTRTDKKKVDKGMGSSLPIQKLDKSNYASWAYKMRQYLLGHGYWSYVEGANKVALELTHKEATSRVLYWLAPCVHD